MIPFSPHQILGTSKSDAGRILVVSDLYPPHHLGGYEQACRQVVDGLRSRGYDLMVLTSTFGVTGRDQAQSVRRELWGDYAPGPHHRGGRLSRVHSELHNQLILKRVLREYVPALVYVWNMWGLSMGLLSTLDDYGIPTLYYVHDNWLADGFWRDPWLSYWRGKPTSSLKRFVKNVLHTAIVRPVLGRIVPVEHRAPDLRHVCFISRFRKDECLAKGWSVEHARVVYNGIDFTTFHPPAGRQDHPDLRILFAGRLVPGKGAHTVIEALAEMPPLPDNTVSLTLAGSGASTATGADPYTQELHALVDRKGLQARVRFLGRVPPGDMPRVYREHDVLVFSSLELEGLPLVLLEAMASGLVVVSTTVGGAAEILVHGENCLTFEPGDAGSLAAHLTSLLQNCELRMRLAAAGLETVKRRFTFSHTMDQIEETIHEALQ